MIEWTVMITCMPKLKHLKDTQWTRNIVCNHQDKLWDKSHHQQNNSKLINQEFIVISYRREHYQLQWKNVLMMRMHITLKNILIILMNELFIKSLINDIGWRNIKEENSWSYARRFYHKRLMMVQESSITIQDMIWRIEINQSNFVFEKCFSYFYKYHSGHTKWRKHSHLMF